MTVAAICRSRWQTRRHPLPALWYGAGGATLCVARSPTCTTWPGEATTSLNSRENDLHDVATVEACRQLIDATFRGGAPMQSDVTIIREFLADRPRLWGEPEAA